MREVPYKTFSLRTHKSNWSLKRPNVCQFELTFGCRLHCKHCYTDCYNRFPYLRKELDTREVKFILDKVYGVGVLWLCFTGGDPLTRADFLDIYSYAKNKGFIVTIFTNAYSMTKEITKYLQKKPPFVIEITLNAVTKDLYEKISQVKGSFIKVMRGIDLILKAKLPLKIKTQVTCDNLGEKNKIKRFIEGLGLKFQADFTLHARLNSDLTPCNLRVLPEEILRFNGRKQMSDNDCRLPLKTDNRRLTTDLFLCAIGSGDGMYIDPCGNIIPCNCIRNPKVNLLKEDIEVARKNILDWIRARHFTNNSKCNVCPIRDRCYNCPGKAWLEKGSLEEIVDWFCELAHLTQGLFAR